MLRRAIALAILLLFSVQARADYIADRKDAMELVRGREYEAALAAFTKMAEGTDRDRQKSDALEQAALCAHHLKRYREALELAQQIPLTPASKRVQMRIMHENRKRRELIDKFKDEDLGAWPEKDAGAAFFYRGEAYFSLKMGAAAEADLEGALENLGKGPLRGQAALTLAHNYRWNLPDDQAALNAYVRMQEIERTRDQWGWLYLTAVTAAADILRRQKKHDEALAMLGQVAVDKMGDGYWKVALLCAYGETRASQGQKAKALARFREALAVKGIADAQKAACQRRIEKLEGDAE